MCSVYDKYLEQVKLTKAANTYIRAAGVIKKFAKFEFSKDGLLEYIKVQKEKGLSDSTLAIVDMSILRKMFKSLNAPSDMIDLTKEIRGDNKIQAYSTETQVEEIINSIKDKDLDKKLVIAFCYYSGLRISETLSLQWKDISDTAFVVRHTKTKSDRVVPILSKQLRTILKAYKGKKHTSNMLFPKIKQNSIQKYFKYHVTKLGYPELHLHSLRAGFVTKAFERNIDPKTTMAITGHKQMSNVQRYAHCTPAMLEKAKQIFA